MLVAAQKSGATNLPKCACINTAVSWKQELYNKWSTWGNYWNRCKDKRSHKFKVNIGKEIWSLHVQTACALLCGARGYISYAAGEDCADLSEATKWKQGNHRREYVDREPSIGRKLISGSVFESYLLWSCFYLCSDMSLDSRVVLMFLTIIIFWNAGDFSTYRTVCCPLPTILEITFSTADYYYSLQNLSLSLIEFLLPYHSM